MYPIFHRKFLYKQNTIKFNKHIIKNRYFYISSATFIIANIVATNYVLNKMIDTISY